MEKRGSKIGLRTAIFALLFIIIIVSIRIFLPLPAIFLLVKDNIHRADCIVPLGGDLHDRFSKAVELYEKDYSKNILISLLPETSGKDREYCALKMRIYGIEEVPREEFVLMALKYFGKDHKGVYFTDQEVTSTYEEALATKDFMLKKGFKSLILVTSNYHTRRALMLFQAVFWGSGIKIYNSTAGRESMNPRGWWKKEREVKAVIQEHVSIIHNVIYHFILSKKRTSFDTY